MLTTLALLSTLISQPAPSDDPCSSLLVDAPNLDGLAVELAVECDRDRAAVTTQIEHAGIALARPDWAFADMDHAPELDAELADIEHPTPAAARTSPFAPSDYVDPFANNDRKPAPDFDAEPRLLWWGQAKSKQALELDPDVAAYMLVMGQVSGEVVTVAEDRAERW
jgi:hypothetical protein